MHDEHSNFPVVRTGQIGAAEIPTVNARDLHAFLGVGKVFAAWIQERIDQYGFVDHRDFEVFSETGNNSKGGRPAKEYAISIDMAKELAMVERNEKGKQARQYFIECERRAKQPVDIMQALDDPAFLRRALSIKNDEVEQLRAITTELAPKAVALDRIATAEGSLCLTDAAKSLQVRRKDLIKELERARWIYRRPGAKTWLAYDGKRHAGLMEHKTTTVEREDGSEKVVSQARITPKGLVKLAEVLGMGGMQ